MDEMDEMMSPKDVDLNPLDTDEDLHLDDTAKGVKEVNVDYKDYF